MRRNFADILKSAKVDTKAEYQKLFGMVFDRNIQVSNTKRISTYDELGDYFLSFHFRGTCLSIKEFDELHGFRFEKDPPEFSIDHLITLCEYTYNMLIGYQTANGYQYGAMMPLPINVPFYLAQITQVIEAVGYMSLSKDKMTIFVEKDPAAIAVSESELIPEELSYKLFSYNHHKMKGQLEEKKSVLQQIAAIIEGKRDELKKADSTLEADLFFMFNNVNIRHNNVDPKLRSKYNKYVAQMSPEELEKWYDETYQMCLLSIMQLEHAERRQQINDLKTKIQDTKISAKDARKAK